MVSGTLFANGEAINAGRTSIDMPYGNEISVLFLTLRADFGGGPEHLWQLLLHAPASFRPYVACPEDYPYCERFREIVGSDRLFTLPHRQFSIQRLWQLRSFCREQGITVLHSHGKGAGVYARLLAMLTGLPCVHTFHGVHMNSYGPLKQQAYRACEQCLSLFTHTGIAVSEGEKAKILEERLIPIAKLRLIPNGVNIPAETAIQPDAPASPHTVVTLSRFDYPKNSTFLLDIASALNAKGRLGEFRFVAVGDGEDRHTVVRMAQEHGWSEAVVCPGATTQPHAFFENALCYVSTSRWEGMPLAVLEAMAHGLPVVATDVIGNRDAVRHAATGLLYAEGDAAAAADALCQLADDAALRCSLGAEARAYVLAAHSAREMADKTFAVLQQACE